MKPSLVLAFVISFFFTVRASAESHTIKFVNQCGFGTPALVLNGNNILSGDQYTSNGPFSGIAYLQTGYCNTNGENCTLMEMTLINPTCAGCGSSADLSLISPHAYSVETSFSYYNGCDGVGQTCASPNCSQNAFFVPTDNFVQKECQATDVDLLISFCVEASGLVGGTNSASSTPTNAPTSTVASATSNAQPTSTPKPSTASHSSATTSSTPNSTPTVISAASTGKQCTAGSRRKRQVNRVQGSVRRRRHTKSSPHQA